MTRKEVERALDYMFDDDYFVENCVIHLPGVDYHGDDVWLSITKDGLEITCCEKYGKIVFLIRYDKIKDIEFEDLDIRYCKFYRIKVDPYYYIDIDVDGFPEDDYEED